MSVRQSWWLLNTSHTFFVKVDTPGKLDFLRAPRCCQLGCSLSSPEEHRKLGHFSRCSPLHLDTISTVPSSPAVTCSVSRLPEDARNCDHWVMASRTCPVFCACCACWVRQPIQLVSQSRRLLKNFTPFFPRPGGPRILVLEIAPW